MISEIDTSSVVDETESAKVTSEAMALRSYTNLIIIIIIIISDGRVFHRVDAATRNDRWPMDSSRYAGMSSWCDVDERRLRVRT